MATGLAAWQWALEGAKLKGVLLLHLAFAVLSSICILIAGGIHLRAIRKPKSSLSAIRLPVELLGALLLAITGHLGGFVRGASS